MKKNEVLNLVISGIPSIPEDDQLLYVARVRFKPCYKWNTFNTYWACFMLPLSGVLNLVISGIPSILIKI